MSEGTIAVLELNELLGERYSVSEDTSDGKYKILLTNDEVSIPITTTLVVENLEITVHGETRTITYRTALDLNDLADVVVGFLGPRDKARLQRVNQAALQHHGPTETEWLNSEHLVSYLDKLWFEGTKKETNMQKLQQTPDLVNIELHLRAKENGPISFIINQSRYRMGRLTLDFERLRPFITPERIRDLNDVDEGEYIAHTMGINEEIVVEQVFDSRQIPRTYVYFVNDEGCHVFALLKNGGTETSDPPIVVSRIHDLDWDAPTITLDSS